MSMESTDTVDILRRDNAGAVQHTTYPGQAYRPSKQYAVQLSAEAPCSPLISPKPDRWGPIY